MLRQRKYGWTKRRLYVARYKYGQLFLTHILLKSSTQIEAKVVQSCIGVLHSLAVENGLMHKEITLQR
jgi:hypothetical protein